MRRLLCALLLGPSLAEAAAPLPPPLAPLSPEAAPLPPEDIPRRSYELTLRGGAAALRCDGAAPSALTQVDPCARLGAGRQLGGAALLRPWGHAAIGLAVHGSWFPWGARDLLGEGQGEGRWTSVALAARGYLHEEGSWEPYIGYQAGLAWLTLRGERGDVAIQREGLAMAGQLGVEGWVSSRMRLGIEGEVRWQATGDAELCTSGACLGAPVARLPDRSLGVHATITVALGEQL